MCTVKTCMPFNSPPAPEGYVRWACLMACGATRYVERPKGARIPRDLTDCCSVPTTTVPQEAALEESPAEEPDDGFVKLEELLPEGIFDG